MSSLYDFQQKAVDSLIEGKHIIFASCGCLSKGTPVRMANGTFKRVEDIKQGDLVLGYDEYENRFIASEVGGMFRTCHKPKPMIEFECGNETIRTTYDHPFYNGKGFYPLYQLIWGALEAGQRVQLKLLCEQYGQAFDYKKTKCKHSCCDDTCERCQRLLPNGNESKNSKGPQNSSRELVGEPEKLAVCEPHKWRQGRQSGGKFGVVFCEIQRLVGDENGNDKTTYTPSECKTHERRARICEETVLNIQEKGRKNRRVYRQNARKIPRHGKVNYKGVGMGASRPRILQAEPYYTISLRTAPHTYCIGKKHSFIVHNSGKNPMSMVWAAQKCEETGKRNILVVTTASKARTADHMDDLRAFCPGVYETLESFEVISWHKLAKWVNANWKTIEKWVIVFDEIQRGSAGVSSGMGKAFLKITKRNKDWAGFTGTPGDTWLKFYPYFTACGLVINKTSFLDEYANIRTYKGYPEIIGWRNEDQLKKMWAKVSYAPDTSKMVAELPTETHKVVTFNKAGAYNKVLKTRTNEGGEFLDTAGALCAELRRLCFTKDKQEWIRDFVTDLEAGCVFFYNFIKTGDILEEIIAKTLPKGARVWRIDGTHHEIPTADTIGEHDMVLCQWQSGSEALNLQFLHYWVSVEACYSYSTSIQARGRIKRIGQKMPMVFFYLKTEHTIEDDIYKCLATKSDFGESNWCIDKGLIKEEEEVDNQQII